MALEEWSRENQFNSFNSWKGLLYAPWYQAVIRGEFLPPVEASLDPIHACNLRCAHCLNGEEHISMPDFTSKKIKDVKIGDMVLGLKDSKIAPVKVLNVFNNGTTTEMLHITFEDGDSFECTPEHKIWESRSRWKRAGWFKVGDYVKKAFRFNRPEVDTKEYQEGYISGMASGDGCFWMSANRNGGKSGRFRLSLHDIVATEKFGEYCTNLGINWHWGNHDYTGHKDYQKGQKFRIKALWITDAVNAKKVKQLMDTDKNSLSFKIGWVAGMFDAEGSRSGVLRISQYPSTIRDKLIQYCQDLRYSVVEEEKGIRLKGRVYDALNFFLDHDIKIKRKMTKTLGCKVYSKKRITAIETIQGKFHKWDMETETHNYLVKGVLVHNCNAHRYIVGEDNKALHRMSDSHLIRLVEFLAEWGVKAICFGGGGEPTLHTGLPQAVKRASELGLKTSIASNGTHWGPEMLEVLPLMRWAGISVDAANGDTYKSLKRVNKFPAVIENLKNMVAVAGGCDISFKFLITEVNQKDIAEACRIASNLGVRDFHARPADFSHQGMGELAGRIGNVDIGGIVEQFEECHRLEREDFRVFTVVHKFDQDFKPMKRFKQCWAAPLTIQLCANGWVYMCVDQRHRKEYALGKHDPDPWEILKFWGGDKHKDLVFCDTPYTCTTRCTYGVYNEQCEKLFHNKTDPMCWEFP